MVAVGSAPPEWRRNRLESRTDVAGRHELIVQTTQPAIGDARAETRTECDEPGDTLLERIPFVHAMPASAAARRAASLYCANVRRGVGVTIRRNLHGRYPRLFQYDANTRADSA
ncbi:hypothetical protein OKW42_005468 [Paraburkholderia sp. WC7.3d]